MTGEPPHVAVGYSDQVPVELFAEFEQTVAAKGLRLRIGGSGPFGPFMGVEEWLPTIIIVWISKAYFDGFLKEAGKDHYQLLKLALSKLYNNFASPQANARVTAYGTKDKIREVRRYSVLYSIYADAAPGLRMKLLIPCEQTEEEYVELLTAFLTFLDNFHAQTLPQDQVELLRHARVSGGTCLLVYSPTTRRIEPYDSRQ